MEAIAFLYCKLREYKKGKYYIEQALNHLKEQHDQTQPSEQDLTSYKQNETRILLKIKNLQYFFETPDQSTKNILADLINKGNGEKIDEPKTNLDNDDECRPMQQDIQETCQINQTEPQPSGVNAIEDSNNKSDNSESNTQSIGNTDLNPNESQSNKSLQNDSKQLSKSSPIPAENEMENVTHKKPDVAETSKSSTNESMINPEKRFDNKSDSKKYKNSKRFFY